MRGRTRFASRGFLSAVDFVQADRFRRKVATEMARIFSQVDLLLVPSLRDEMLTITNFTGHPSLTLACGLCRGVARRAAIGRRIRRIRCRSSRRRAACRTV